MSSPLSSRSSRFAPRRRAFFDARPVRLQPPGDGLVIALAGPAPRLLGREPAPAKPGRQVVRVEVDAELLLDEPGQPRGGPQPGGEAVLGRVVGQPTADDLLLGGGQFGRPPGHGLRRQAVGPLSSECGDPAADGTGSHAEEVSDLLDRVALTDSLDGEATTVFQNDR